MTYLDEENLDVEGDQINIDKPDDWDIRRILEKKCANMVGNGPGTNTLACIRLMKIMDAIEAIDEDYRLYGQHDSDSN